MFRNIIIPLIALAVTFTLIPYAPDAQAVVVNIVFPVLGEASYWNDFGAARDGGRRKHIGNDLITAKHTPLLATESGRISYIAYPERSWGMSITLRGNSGYSYTYIHVNNDRPRSDDGSGLPWFAYAPGITDGSLVRQGQIIGYAGDSGNAERVTSMLHFEMRDSGGNVINPYDTLRAARTLTVPSPPLAQKGEVFPYGTFQGGANVAVGNFDDDSKLEVAVAPRAGGGPHVKLFDDDGKSMDLGFFAYQRDYPGGLDIAAGDLDNDGIDEIISAPGPGGTPHIRTFTADGTPFGITQDKPFGVEFLAFERDFSFGTFVDAADLDGDGKAEIIIGSGSGTTPRVRVFSSEGKQVSEFLAYPAGFRGGIDVAAAGGYIITAPQKGGGPHIKIFDMNGKLIDEFSAYDSTFKGGVRISARGDINQRTTKKDPRYVLGLAISCTEELIKNAYGKIITIRECVDDDAPKTEDTTSPKPPVTRMGPLEIITAPASGGGPDIRLFNQNGKRMVRKNNIYEHWWLGGYDVALGDNAAWVITGPGPEPNVSRHVSLRKLPSEFR